MLSTVHIAAVCPKCGGTNLACRYNFFDRGDLQVYAWEHKCPDCGWRETKAFRSDDPPRTDEINPAICPFCQRTGS